MEFKAFGLLNVPLGADQVPLVADPPTLPDKVIGAPEQVVCALPALAVGLVSTEMNTLANT